MVILFIHKNHFKIIIVATLVILLGVVSINTLIKSQQYNATAYNTSAYNAGGLEGQQAEIFDISQGKVIKTVPLNKTILAEAKKCLQGIDGIYAKVNAFPDKGFIIKIPFESAAIIKNPILNKSGFKSIDKVFILLPEQNAPYLLILDDKERPFFFIFRHSVKKLIKSLDFETD